MHLWILTTKTPLTYDCTYGFVVRAPSARAARKLASREAGDEGASHWLKPQTTRCHKLSEEGKKEIIVNDYRAG